MNMVKKEQDKKSIRVKFLDEHEITGKLRGRMVDWMVEVMSAYKCKE
jgi:translation initiation factor IF-1